MAILYRPKPLTVLQCYRRYYGALIHVSMGYSPVKGRFHTRCAPVRRSSAESKLSPLPLDLHVLGLPLAFILSQDQTLHCRFLYNISPSTTKHVPGPVYRYDKIKSFLVPNSPYLIYKYKIGAMPI